MRKFWLITISILLLSSLLFPPGSGKAQTSNTSGPVYIVQEGDYFQDIAYRLHVSQQDLANANGMTDTKLITVGEKLIIPGLEGIHGELTTAAVTFGETLQSLSIRYRIPIKTLERLNHLTSPDELYEGFSLVVLKNDTIPSLGKRAIMGPGQSLLELAVVNDTDPWTILANNQIESSVNVLPGDVIRVPGSDDSGPGAMFPSISAIDTSRIVQGETVEIKIEGTNGLSIDGDLGDYKFPFFQDSGNSYVALQGISSKAVPGLYPLVIYTNDSAASKLTFSQMVLIHSGNYSSEVIPNVDPATLDPKITGPEDQLWLQLASPVNPDKLWDGLFSPPVDPALQECYTSWYGTRRSYNGSAFNYVHTGQDFCGQVGNPIYAAASGIVVYTGLLTVRGNATMIDHGWGVYTAYMHQSEILVKVGDRVEQGQLIGRVGNTGRAEGAHLHFEVLVGDVQVNPLEWLKQVFP